MIMNPVLEAMMNRKSIRAYTDQMPSDEEIEAIVRAGMQAPFAFQMGSLLLSRDQESHPFGAPLLFAILVDSYRHEVMMAKRGWEMATNDLSLLFFGIQDAAYMAQNMVIAAESLGMGSCFLGWAPYEAEEFAAATNLPKRVFPLVHLVMGFPAEDPPTRPRYPLSYTLYEGEYPRVEDAAVEDAMRQMDEGYLAQDYYKKAKIIIPLEVDREEQYTYDTYSWTEHISRKTGQWLRTPKEILNPLKACGFEILPEEQEG